MFYSCLQLYYDRLNDGAIGSGDQVGRDEIEHIDFDALERFFFDTDFLKGATLLSAEESGAWAAPGDAAGLEDDCGAQAGGEGSAADGGRVLERKRGPLGVDASHPGERLRGLVSPSRRRGGRRRGRAVTGQSHRVGDPAGRLAVALPVDGKGVPA